ncbi:hypothetical protein ElyMa_002654400 [Elysia marginata]|uniref:Uncharacterized protein n=1 Tax=Elysia marginata TaxID=1093978 RepID=A0AAV4H6M8_9GAST|nr:hypothetical protein ElyMa_002654400 [Elysia marginata]
MGGGGETVLKVRPYRERKPSHTQAPSPQKSRAEFTRGRARVGDKEGQNMRTERVPCSKPSLPPSPSHFPTPQAALGCSVTTLWRRWHYETSFVLWLGFRGE